MRNALFALLTLLCLVPGAALAKEDGFTSDDEALDGKASPAPKAKPKAKPDAQASPTMAGELPQGPVVVVITAKDSGAAETAAAFEAALVRHMEADGRLPVVNLLKVLGGEPEPAPAKPEAEESFKKGKDAYDNLDPEGAAKEFMNGLRVLAEDPLAAKPAMLARAMTWIGAAQLINGDNERAAESFTGAAVMAPSYAPDPNEFSPDILAAFNDAKGKAAGGAKGSLAITSNVSPTVVSVDETERGVAPLTIKDLPAGRHHVVVKSRGYKPWATFVEVQAGGSAAATAELKPLAEADRFRRAVETAQTELKETKPAAGVQELAAAVEARHVIVGVAVSGVGAGANVELSAFDVAARRRVVGLKKDLLVGASTFDNDSRDMATRIFDGLLKNEPIGAGPSKPITERPWFWPVVGCVGGAIVVGAVAGIVAATASGGGHQSGLLITGIP